MATITQTELVQHPGVLWLRGLELWYLWIGDAAKNIIAPVLNASTLGVRAVKMSYTLGADTYEHILCVASLNSSSSNTGADYIMNCAGWFTPPRIIDQGYTALTIATTFSAVMLALRKIVWESFCGMSTVTYSSQAYTGIITGFNATQYWSALRRNGWTGVDASQVMTKLTGTTVVVAGDAQPSDGRGGGPGVYVASGSAATNITPIVTALQDLFHKETVAQMNNGQFTVMLGSGDTLG